MAGESPRGGAVQSCGGEGIEAQLTGTGVDVIGDLLQGLEIGDVGQFVTGLLQQSLVDDNAESLIAVANGNNLTGIIVQVKGIGGHFLVHVGIPQVQAVVAPGLHSALVANLEQGRSGGLVHLGGEGVVVGAGSGSHNRDLHAGLFGIQLGQILPGLVSFGLEVQVVHGAGSGCGRLGSLGGGLSSLGVCGFGVAGGSGVGGLTCTGGEAQDHNRCQQQCDDLLHVLFLLINSRFSGFADWKRFQILVSILYNILPGIASAICREKRLSTFSPKHEVLFCAVRRKIICISSYREIGNDSNSVDSCRGQADRFAFPAKSPRRRFQGRHRGQNFQAACKIYPKSSPLPCLAGAERNIWIFLIFFTCTFGRTVIGRYRSQDPEGIPQNGGRLPPGRQEITNGHIRGVISLHFGHHFRYHAGHCDFPLRTG